MRRQPRGPGNWGSRGGRHPGSGRGSGPGPGPLCLGKGKDEGPHPVPGGPDFPERARGGGHRAVRKGRCHVATVQQGKSERIQWQDAEAGKIQMRQKVEIFTEAY
ncbi:unnamed protein product [Natator depressus]